MLIWREQINIARATTDPGYWVRNLRYLCGLNKYIQRTPFHIDKNKAKTIGFCLVSIGFFALFSIFKHCTVNIVFLPYVSF